MRLHEFIHLSRAETAAASTAEGVYLVMSGVQTDGLTGPPFEAELLCPPEGVAEAAPQAFNSFERLLT